jgi:cyclase
MKYHLNHRDPDNEIFYCNRSMCYSAMNDKNNCLLDAKKSVELGAGEILINSVEKDGSYLGYDKILINSVCTEVTVPVIASGGAKNAKDMIDVLQNTPASAASASNFFHFTEHSVNITKSNIINQLDVRLETFADYRDSHFDEEARLVKKDDEDLEKMLFMKIEKEVI